MIERILQEKMNYLIDSKSRGGFDLAKMFVGAVGNFLVGEGNWQLFKDVNISNVPVYGASEESTHAATIARHSRATATWKHIRKLVAILPLYGPRSGWLTIVIFLAIELRIRAVSWVVWWYKGDVRITWIFILTINAATTTATGVVLKRKARFVVAGPDKLGRTLFMMLTHLMKRWSTKIGDWSEDTIRGKRGLWDNCVSGKRTSENWSGAEGGWGSWCLVCVRGGWAKRMGWERCWVFEATGGRGCWAISLCSRK